MGCYPLGKMVSRALGKCSGKERDRGREVTRTVIYSPPPTISYSKSAVKTVRFSNDNSVIMIPPNPTHGTIRSKHHHPAETLMVSPSPEACSVSAAQRPEAVEVMDHHPQAYVVTNGPDFPSEVSCGWKKREQPMPTYSAYVASPLPVWEEGERRRREYLGGEYHYYPTPIREGIYSLATDANRITTMFSEENPNACSIT